MEKLSDSWYHPINSEVIKELMVSLDVGKGKDYTSKMVFDVENDKILGSTTDKSLLPFIIGKELVWSKSLDEAIAAKSKFIGSICKVNFPFVPIMGA